MQETHNQSWLVRYYYTHRIFMGFCCVCCEVLYLAIYMLGWQQLWAAPDKRAFSINYVRGVGGTGKITEVKTSQSLLYEMLGQSRTMATDEYAQNGTVPTLQAASSGTAPFSSPSHLQQCLGLRSSSSSMWRRSGQRLTH